MAKGDWKIHLQGLIRIAGYQLRRMDTGVSLEDPYAVQKSMLGSAVKTIVEVGAADGRDSEAYCEAFPTADVYAFEPVPSSFSKLEARAERIPRLHAFALAVSDTVGVATLHIAEWDDASSLLRPRDTGSTFDAYHKTKERREVAVTTLDAFCAGRGMTHIELLKIDAQGLELSILRGAERLLADGAIDMIFAEVQFLQLYEGAARYDEIAAFLHGHQFLLHNLYGLHHNHRGELCWGDALFIRQRRSECQS